MITGTFVHFFSLCVCVSPPPIKRWNNLLWWRVYHYYYYYYYLLGFFLYCLLLLFSNSSDSLIFFCWLFELTLYMGVCVCTGERSQISLCLESFLFFLFLFPNCSLTVSYLLLFFSNVCMYVCIVYLFEFIIDTWSNEQNKNFRFVFFLNFSIHRIK